MCVPQKIYRHFLPTHVVSTCAGTSSLIGTVNNIFAKPGQKSLSGNSAVVRGNNSDFPERGFWTAVRDPDYGKGVSGSVIVSGGESWVKTMAYI